MDSLPHESAALRNEVNLLAATVARQSALISALSEDAKKNHTAIASLIALTQALVESHPHPSILAQEFLDQIDRVASIVPPESAELYRSDLQKTSAFILDVANRKGFTSDPN